MSNRIVIENAQTSGLITPSGEPLTRAYWDVPHTAVIEGFTTDISVNAGGTVNFKINVNNGAGSDYRIEIFRLGYYGGAGARGVAQILNTNAIDQDLPLFDESLGLVDAGNWLVTDSWDVPADAVSGVYLARVQRLDVNGQPIPGEANQIPFIVRNDGVAADIVLQTSDTTWHAYNGWAGELGNSNQAGPNFYGDAAGIVSHDPLPNSGSFAQNRAYAVSYNRPFITRDGTSPASGAHDYLFGADYAAIYWLEKNGYDISYISGVDTDRLGADYLKNYKSFISVGHDEYWSGDQRINVEEARDSGVNLLFWSGNEVYWKTRWETSISADGTAYRTLVCYKETWANGDQFASPEDYNNIDPSNIWTGTWRDTRFHESVDAEGNFIAGGPSYVHSITGLRSTCNCAENSLTGQLFGPDGTGEFGGALDVPPPFAGLRLWRDTAVAAGGALDLAPGILGYEWNTSPDDASRPAGLIKLSETTIPWGSIVTDQGNQGAPGIATHNLSLYRAESGALVFGAGTVFWSWALSDEHDSTPYGALIENQAIQQFTVNMFADMGIQPGVADAVLFSHGLTRASASADTVGATATLNAIASEVSALSTVLITGSATDDNGTPTDPTDDGKIAVVEVSLDGGASWRVAQGTSNWSYAWRPSTPGSYTITSRAIDDSLNITSLTLAQATVTVTAPITPESHSLFDPALPVNGQLFNDNMTYELGMTFRPNQAGSITELKYFRAAADANDTDVRLGRLWRRSDGALLATVTFTSSPGQSGWQAAALSAPLAVTAGTDYVVSYITDNNYISTPNFFSPANEVAFDGIDDNAFTDPFGILSAPQSTVVAGGGTGGNGVFRVGSGLTIPNETFRASNYWVDVTLAPAGSLPPVNGGAASFSITGTPAVGGTLIATTTADDPNGNGSFSYSWQSLESSFTEIPIWTPIGSDDNTLAISPAEEGKQIRLIVSYTDGQGFAESVATIPVIVTATPSTVSLFDPALPVNGPLFNDNTTYELGMTFRPNQAGSITELKYFRAAADANDTDVRLGRLWRRSDGALLATVTFTSSPGQSGWQAAALSAPLAVTAGTDYVVSYITDNNYISTPNFFSPANEVAFDGIDDNAFTDPFGILSAPQSTVVAGGGTGGNGVFRVGSGLTIPNETFRASNYWVDVTLAPAGSLPPVNGGAASFSITGTPAVGGTLIATTTADDPNGNSSFSYSWQSSSDGSTWSPIGTNASSIVLTPAEQDKQVRALVSYTDGQGFAESVATIPVIVTATPSTVSLFDPALPVNGPLFNDNTTYELGMTFRPNQAGSITELKYFRAAADANDTDVRLGRLWRRSDGALLATVTFTSSPGQSGWQAAALSAPLAVTAGTDYVVSYITDNNYISTPNFFSPANEVAFDGIDDNAFTDPFGILSAPQSTVVAGGGTGGNGVFRVGSGLTIPNETFRASNYWVDVTFAPAVGTSVNDDGPILGTEGNDILTFTTAVDAITGLDGADTFRLTTLTHSLLTTSSNPSFDRITDLEAGLDLIDAPINLTPATAINPTLLATPVSNLNATGAGSIGALLSALNFPASAAVAFTFNDPTASSRTFLALNNNTAGFDASTEAILEITGYSGNLTQLEIF